MAVESLYRTCRWLCQWDNIIDSCGIRPTAITACFSHIYLNPTPSGRRLILASPWVWNPAPSLACSWAQLTYLHSTRLLTTPEWFEQTRKLSTAVVNFSFRGCFNFQASNLFKPGTSETSYFGTGPQGLKGQCFKRVRRCVWVETESQKVY